MPDNEILSFTSECDWEKVIQERTLADSAPAVYALVSEASFGRLIGESKVLYVGKASCLGGSGDGTRLYSYCYQKANSRDGRIRELAKKAMKNGYKLKLRWQVMESEVSAAAKEAELLKRYMVKHLEVPPFNSKST